MPRAYGKVEMLSEEVFPRKAAGETNWEIAESYGFTLKQVKQLIKRQNNKAKKIANTTPTKTAIAPTARNFLLVISSMITIIP